MPLYLILDDVNDGDEEQADKLKKIVFCTMLQ